MIAKNTAFSGVFLCQLAYKRPRILFTSVKVAVFPLVKILQDSISLVDCSCLPTRENAQDSFRFAQTSFTVSSENAADLSLRLNFNAHIL